MLSLLQVPELQEKLLVARQLLCISETPMWLLAGTTPSTSGKTSLQGLQRPDMH